jgi:AraC-like DNA-binding protein
MGRRPAGANFAWAVSALGDIESKRGADRPQTADELMLCEVRCARRPLRRSRRLTMREGGRVALELACDTLRQPLPKPRARRGSTGVTHHLLAEAAKSRLAQSPAEPLPLQELARALHTSPFHLARVFRAETGFSVNGYRSAFRLRIALSRLAGGGGGLVSLPLELGFSSHSHFTDTFRPEFGVVPSTLCSRAWRRSVR